MVKHVILWKLKDEVTGDAKEKVLHEMKENLEALVGKVPGLLRLEIVTKPLASSSRAATLPLRTTLPLVGSIMPVMAFSSVDFPAPLVPIIPSISPASIEKVISLSAQNSLTL